ncbi:MAG: NAD-dependent DNA ligase LigA [Metamycoplasmataceae bacterium]
MKKEKEIRNEIEILRKKINLWNEEYFLNNNPSVSDRVYDTSLKKLLELEKKYPEFSDINSPTNIIGDFAKNKFKKYIHSKKMLSLNKAYSFEEIEKFMNDVNSLTGENNYFYLEPKIDGLSISLIYENGLLIQATTRGDGTVGEDVSDNIFNIIQDIPIKIKRLEKIEIRGEIYISLSNFQNILDQGEQFANPRNAASGTLRQLDKEVVKKRNLSCFVYEITNWQDLGISSYKDTIDFLLDNNFKIQKDFFLSNNFSKICAFIAEFKNKKNQLNYEIDGLVIKMNDLTSTNKIGYTSKFPKYNIAFKFDDEIVETIVRNIFITIGRTGMVTYNAKLEPVLLKGSVVSAATLHNYNYVKEINLNINDTVRIKKAGEIIPKVIDVSKKSSNGIFEKINNCPFCQSLLIYNNQQSEEYCKNNFCDEKNIRKLIHFASRDALDINHLGEQWIRNFYKEGILSKISDIFILEHNKEKIISLDGFGNKSYDNLISSINESKNVSLEKLIFALGIERLGQRNARILASEIQQFHNILSFDFDQLINIKDIGPLTVLSLKEYFYNESNKEEIKKIISFGINPSVKIIEKQFSVFSNKKIAITGSFELPRNEIKKILEKKGALYSSSISAKTDFLLCGENPGSKKDKAFELGIKIISLEDL